MHIFGEIAHELCEQVGGAGLSSSVLDSWVSTLDITTVERASCEVYKLLRSGEDPAALVSIVLKVGIGLPCFCANYA